MSVRTANRELTELVQKQTAFTTRKRLVKSEFEYLIDRAGEVATESGIIESGKITDKQAELKVIDAVLDNLEKKIPIAEAKVRQSKREHAQSKVNKLAGENNKLLLDTSKQLLKIVEKWLPVQQRLEDAEKLRGGNPRVSFPMSVNRAAMFYIRGLILSSVAMAKDLNPEIEPLLKEFEKLGLGARL